MMIKKKIHLNIFFVLLLIIITNNFIDFEKKEYNIIETNNYKDFENIKNIYIKHSFYKQFLDEISVLLHIFIDKKKIKKNIINVSMSLNNKYAFIILVSMESILMNTKKNETYIIFHLQCSSDIKEDSIVMIKSLMEKYASNLELIFYRMGNNFYEKKNLFRSQATYFRLLLPIMINSDRIIYLDGDTLSLKDMAALYNYDIKNYYVLGFLGLASWGLDYLGIKANNWINAGVLLFNLKKIRHDKKCYDLLKATKSKIHFKHYDNTIINYVFYPKIGKLPAKYGIFNFYDKTDLEKYSKSLREKINITKYIEAIKDPGLIHMVLCYPKPWYYNSKFSKQVTACEKRNNCSCKKFHSLWHFYAKKTGYYSYILSTLTKK